jgi:hypothetical protein
MRRENGALPLEPRDRSINKRLFQKNADIVAKVAGRKIVRAIDDEIIRRKNPHRIRGFEADIVKFDANMRIYLAKTLAGALDLLFSDIPAAMQDLTLEVRLVHHIEIDDSQSANPCGGEVKSHRRSKSSRSDTENLGGFQAFLPLESDLRQRQVPRVAGDLALAKLHLRHTGGIEDTGAHC